MAHYIFYHCDDIDLSYGKVKFSNLGFYTQGQLLEGVECHIYLYCFTFDDNNLNRAFIIFVLFPKKKKNSNKKVCANDLGN